MKTINHLFISIILLFLSTVSAQNSGQLKFDRETCDYGKLKPGEKAECVFVFENSGDKDIQIKSVKSNSKHIKLKLSDSLIQKGETEKLTVTYKSESEGPIRKTITLFTDATPQLYTLSVKGRISAQP